METNTHKILDIVEHTWPYISGITITMFAALRLWWHSRQEMKRRIATLEVLAENSVSQLELASCKEDVKEIDNENLEKLYKEIRDINAENAKQHQDILTQVIKLHSKD